MTMIKTRKLQGFGCSFKGFQTFLRRNNENALSSIDDDEGSDADWYTTSRAILPSYEYYFEGCRDDMPTKKRRLHVNDLPDEVLINIFSYISARNICKSVLPVCRLWYKLGNDPVLWTRLDFAYRTSNTHVTMVKIVSLRFQFMNSLSLKNFRSAEQMERMLLHMGNKCARLKEIQLFNCALRSDTLVRLGEMCPNITSLSLICCDENYRKNHYLWPYMKDCSFITSFPRLTSLCLLRTLALATLSFEDAQNIVRVCKNLKRLVLDCDFYGRAIRYIISSLSDSLEVLWLQGRNYNDSMCQEISKCHKLRELGLSHVESITPFGLKFLGSLHKLEKLLLFYANDITPKVFREFFVAGQLRNLRYVNLSGCRGVDVSVESSIRKHCPKVKEVILHKRVVRREAAYIEFGLWENQNNIRVYTTLVCDRAPPPRRDTTNR